MASSPPAIRILTPDTHSGPVEAPSRCPPGAQNAHLGLKPLAGPVEERSNCPSIRDKAGRSAPAIEPLLVTADQASTMCGISSASWYRMASAGRCPAPVRLSRGCVRWRAEELQEWIAAGCPDRRIWEALKKNRSR